MEIYAVNARSKVELNIPAGTGEYRTICPICSHLRKRENQNKRVLSYNRSTLQGYCSHCNEVFYPYNEDLYRTDYILPDLSKQKIIEKEASFLEYWAKRGISKETLELAKVTEQIEFIPQENKEVKCTAFNYFRNGELINIKYRSKQKNFKLISGSELILYNLDSIKIPSEDNYAVICEGEPDALSYIEAGIKRTLSVPNGAGAKNQNLKYIDNCYEDIKDIETWYISVDSDANGMALRNELIRRLGYNKCKIIDLNDCKDANEYLVKYGKESLLERFKTAKYLPLYNVYDYDDNVDDLIDLWDKGMPKGASILHQKLNKLITWATGQLCVVTGIPSSGKSVFVDEIVYQLNILHQWKAVYFSPEFSPTKLHVAQIIEKITGNSFKRENMSKEDLMIAIDYVKDNFFMLEQREDNGSIERILEMALDVVRKRGVKILVIDPFNMIDKDSRFDNMSSIAHILKSLINFAKKNDVLVFLVAHPTKPSETFGKSTPMPSLYSISGSADFKNMTYYGLVFHRTKGEVLNLDYDINTCKVEKIKYRHLGKEGQVAFAFNTKNSRFIELDNECYNPVEDNSNYLHWKPNLLNETKHVDYQFTPNTNFDNQGFEDSDETPF